MAGLRSTADHYRFSYHDPDHDDARSARRAAERFSPDAARTFYAGEPISRLPARPRDASMLRALFIIALLSGAGWGLMKTEATWRPIVEPAIASVLAEIERARSQASSAAGGEQKQAAARAAPEAPPAEPLSQKDVARAPGEAFGERVATAADAVPDVAGRGERAAGEAEASAAAEAHAAAMGLDAPPAPLPPPEADPADPHQQRALAAGLHPGLSRALLSRLNEDDFRNAKIAIDTAIAEVAEGAKHVWPKQRAPERALFTVHFVRGAADDCRRYVVTVLKDRWTTTALPMERCGVKVPGARAARGSQT